MMDEVFQFTWSRALGDGYQWRSLTPVDDDQPARVLTDGAAVGGTAHHETTFPLKWWPNLFQTFAGIEPTEAGIREFANTFGHLTGGNGFHGGETMVVGDTLDDWLAAWKEIHLTVAALELVLDPAREADLEKAVQWSGDRQTVRITLESRAGMAGTNIGRAHGSSWVLELVAPGDLRGPLRFDAVRRINAGLAQSAAPQVLWDRDEAQFGTFVRPDSLLGAMWLQLARLMDARKIIRVCETCSNWFEARRPERRFCSTNCRVKAHHDRHGRGEKSGGDDNG